MDFRYGLPGPRQMAMQQVIQPGSKRRDLPPAPLRLRGQRRLPVLDPGSAVSVLPLVFLFAILAGKNLPAQTVAMQSTQLTEPSTSTKTTQPDHLVVPDARAARTQRQSNPEPMAGQPLPSPSPIWPANQPPTRARVSWDGRGLEIEAFNSSLDQILHQVAAATGAKLEGVVKDQRVFGSFGPGPGCDVLSSLLEGTGYNVAMSGSRDADAPLEIILSVRLPVLPHTAGHRNAEDQDTEDQLVPPIPPESPHPPDQNPFANGEKTGDPTKFMEEVLDRQHKIDQQQQSQHDQQNQQDQQNHPDQ